MLVANIFLYYFFLIFIYSAMILEFFGFSVMSPEPVKHPHWLVEWAVLIAVAVTMTVSLIFLVKRFAAVVVRIYRKLPPIIFQIKNKILQQYLINHHMIQFSMKQNVYHFVYVMSFVVHYQLLIFLFYHHLYHLQ